MVPVLRANDEPDFDYIPPVEEDPLEWPGGSGSEPPLLDSAMWWILGGAGIFFFIVILFPVHRHLQGVVARHENRQPPTPQRATRGNHYVSQSQAMAYPSAPPAQAFPYLTAASIQAPPTPSALPREPNGASRTNELPQFHVEGRIALEQCGICLEPLGSGKITTGTCTHLFHYTCLMAWLARDKSQSCPTCRRSLFDVVP